MIDNNSNIDVARIVKHWVETSEDDFITIDSNIDIAVILKDYNNLIDTQLDLMRIRRNIDSRIEPHPFREKVFDITNPIVNEIVKYGQDIESNLT
jgi:hypothetical protein